MQAADIPSRFPIPFGNSADPSNIHDVPETPSVTPGAASLELGFPPPNFLPVGAGGIPPFGNDVNGMFRQITQWSQWQAAGGSVTYDASFATSIGGYPAGAILSSAAVLGYFWLCLVDDNTTDPDAGGANWQSFSPLGGTTGDIKWRADSDAQSGWISANALTVGDSSSNASSLASSLASAIFSYHWSKFSNTQCPVFTSAGAPTTRGATAAADFAAHKAIQVLDLRGAGLKGLDGMGNAAAGRYSGVTFSIGNATTPGSVAGTNTYSLSSAENGAHTHGITDPGHIHGVTDPGHNHVVIDPTHNHILIDAGHTHATLQTMLAASGGLGSAFIDTAGGTNYFTINTYLANATTGILNLVNATGITNTANTTGLTVNSQTTGVTTQSSGGSAHPIVDYSMLGTWFIKL